MTTPTDRREIEILRTGTFQPMRGPAVTVDEDVLSQLAESYDPAQHEAPLVIGHPKHDDPAMGWVEALKVKRGRLVATVRQVVPEFVEKVREGAFKKISASMYPPGHKSNPTPGKWHLKHVGFLGAMAPAVKGLAPVALSEEDEETAVTIELGGGEELSPALRIIGEAFGRLRDWLIEREGADAANTILPRWTIEDITALAGQAEEERGRSPALAEPDAGTVTPTNPNSNEDPMADKEKAEELARRQKELAAREVALAEREAALKRKDNEEFVDGLIKEGRLLPASRGTVLQLMEQLDDQTAVAFGEGDDKQEKTALQAFRDHLAAQPPAVALGEVAGSEGDPTGAAVDFAAPPGLEVDPAGLELHQKALAYQRQHPDTDYLAAVKAVSGSK